MKKLSQLCFITFFALASAIVAVAQTKPVDPATDWLLSQATPATKPSTSEATVSSPILSRIETPAGPRASIELSNGATLTGTLATTAGKPIRVWDEKKKEYIDVPLSRIQSIEAAVVWERDEREWQFKQAGSDQKVYSGKTYPTRELAHEITLKNGTVVKGGVASPIQLTDAQTGEVRNFILHKRDKGEPGTTLQSLVYVRQIVVASEPAAATRPLLPTD